MLASMRASVPSALLVLYGILLFNLLVGTRVSFRVLRGVLDYFAVPYEGAPGRGRLSRGKRRSRNAAGWLSSLEPDRVSG